MAFLSTRQFYGNPRSSTNSAMYNYKGLCYCQYRVSTKKVLHKREEKMHKKMKMTSQRVENLVYAQQDDGKSFYKKIFF